jgi:hypothetical protein
MPVLDAKALRTDPKGLAFLRAVLGRKRLFPLRPPAVEAPPAKATEADTARREDTTVSG